MTDAEGLTSGTADRLCPWCSAAVSGDPARCPSCGASLREQVETTRPAEPLIPGLTEIDPALVRKPAPQKSRGLVAWLTGDTLEDTSDPVADSASLAPPGDDVRREMLRLKMEAVRMELEAEAAAAAASDIGAESNGAAGADVDAAPNAPNPSDGAA